MNFGETMVIETPSEIKALEDSDADALDTVENEENEEESDSKEIKKKKKFGKLPPVPKFSHNDSTTAADDVLKKFFNRR